MIAFVGEGGHHGLKFIQTNELMLAMEFIDAAEAAQPFIFTFRIEANHNDVFPLVLRALLAKMLVVFKPHPPL